ncbi:MAG: cupin [Planctomycetota bacterium]|nr:cupin [Planctomycetota bacterium]
MRLFRFDAGAGLPIDRFESRGVKLARGVRNEGATRVGWMHFERGGVLGDHPAVGDQLFCVVVGEGWVRGADRVRVPVRAGTAAFFPDGELHESGSDTGMTAVLVESAAIDPARYMKPLDADGRRP